MPFVDNCEQLRFVNNPMRFSIVTPNYNYGRFLKKALESVFAQAEGEGAPEIEHIVIDGGSTDDSVSILKEWEAFARGTAAAKASKYTFSYVSEPDNGQTDAINKGLRRATGDVVAWLNADEWYLPGRLALVAAAFTKYPKTDFLYGEPLFVDKDGKPIRIRYGHRFSKFVLFRYGCVIASCASFWRRYWCDKGLYLDSSYRLDMDYELYCHMACAGLRFRFLPTIVAAFVWHDDNISLRPEVLGANERLCVQKTYAPLPRIFAGRSDRGYRTLKWIAHQWRRVLIVVRLVFLPKEKVW